MANKKPDFRAELDRQDDDAPALDYDTAYRGLNLPPELTAKADTSPAPVIVRPDRSIQIGDQFVIHATGMHIAPDVNRQSWLMVAQWLRSLDSTLQWAIGDMVVFAEQRRAAWLAELNAGDEVDQESKYKTLLESTGYAYGTLVNFGGIAEKFPVTRRRVTLTYSHHVAVAGLSEDSQEDYLNQAETNGWSSRALYDACHIPLPSPSAMLDKIHKRRFDRVFRNLSKGTYNRIHDEDFPMIRDWLNEAEATWKARKK